MSSTPEPFEVYAIRYGEDGPRRAFQNMLLGDERPGSDLDLFIWVAKRGDRVFVIDTGMDSQLAERKKQRVLKSPIEALALLGIDAGQVEDVILTHLHYDHAGLLPDFKAARFHLQDAEMDYVTGRCMCSAYLKDAYEIDHVLHMVRCAHSHRIAFHDGSAEIVDGITVHKVGGHTGGLQVVRVWTRRGWIVLASDAAHLYQNIVREFPFNGVYRLDEMFEGYRTVRSLAGGDWDRVIAGHDPLVMALYPPASPELTGLVARLDLAPQQGVLSAMAAAGI